MEAYELIIWGGRVIDPKNARDEIADVAVQNGKIAAVGDLSGALAGTDVDAGGCIVTPGLIDSHAHIAPLAAIGVPADAFCFPSGVTTVNDAGSAGSANYELLRPGLMYSWVGKRIFLHVCPSGLSGFRAQLENIDPADFDLPALRRLKEKYPEEIAGLKIRVGKETNRALGFAPLRRAKEIAEELQLPLMVHCTDPALSMAEILSCLGKGDIITHPYHGHGRTLMEEGGFDALAAARERGVYLDVGDAGRHISFDVMRAAIRKNLWPDTISTDATERGFYNKRTTFSLPFCVSKWLNLGMPLQNAIACVTKNAARMLGMEESAGALSVGMPGDIAVFSVENQPMIFRDGVGNALEGDQILHPRLTVKNGGIVYRDILF